MGREHWRHRVPINGQLWAALAEEACIEVGVELANSPLRVQASCMAMGQAAGATAALAVRLGAPPLAVPLDAIVSTSRAHGAIVPSQS